MEAAVAAGYQFRGRQGYIYPRCVSEPACIPAGTVRLFRQCNAQLDDCAVFPESQRVAYQNIGYVNVFPAGSDPIMGYVYPNVHSDDDGLVDGMELVIGTNPNDSNSDDDTYTDHDEFPQAEVQSVNPLRDPCAGPNVTCPRPELSIFLNGFE